MNSRFRSMVAMLCAASLGACRSNPAPKEDAPPAAGLTDHLASRVTGQRPAAGMIVEKNVMVPMRDGVRLATDIYRPAGEGRFPVVLIRTPYGSETPQYAQRGAYYVEHGYALAVQDCRGKYDSEGDWYGKRDEAKDGSDAITWLGTRPWSDGKVGMTGGSYLGMVQYWVADQENPYLKALVPFVGPVTLGRDTAEFDHIAAYGGRGGAGAQLGWMMLTDGRVNQGDGQGDWFGLTFRAAREHLPLSDYPKIFGREMKWWPAMLTRRLGLWEDYYLRAAQGEWVKPIDPAWWGGWEQRYRKVKVPMLHISGWFDCCGEPPIKNFQLIRKLATERLARDHQQLMMGPWPHGVGNSKNGDLDFGPAAKLDPDSMTVRFFDHWIKGQDNGVEKDSAVHVFVMGENRWREASNWPIPGTKFTPFYFHSNGDAQLAAGGGRLTTDPPATAEPADHYTHDPAKPTPEARSADSLYGGMVERKAVEQRADVVVYTSDPVKDPVEVTGPLSAVIYVSTSAPSTELWVRLVDVYPDGSAYNTFLTYANAYRTEWAKDRENGPDGSSIVKADIILPPTGILFRPGHRIRVELSSGSFPMQVSLNLAAATELTATQPNVAKNTIYHDRAHPSHMLLPVIPREINP